MKKQKVNINRKVARIYIYSVIAFILAGFILLFVFGYNISRYISEQSIEANKKEAENNYKSAYERGELKKEKARIDDETDRNNGTGKYAKEIEFKYDGNKTGKVSFVSTGSEGIQVKFQDGKTVRIDCFCNKIQEIKIVKLEGNDYEDVFFRGIDGGSGGYQYISNLLNTEKCEIIWYYTESYDNYSQKWVKGFNKSDNFLNEEFKKERKYLEEELGPYIEKPICSEDNGRPGVIKATKVLKEITK